MDPNTYVLKLKQELKDTITNLESIQKYLNTHSSSLNAKNKVYYFFIISEIIYNLSKKK